MGTGKERVERVDNGGAKGGAVRGFFDDGAGE